MKTGKEASELLAFCAAFDRRTVGKSDVAAWLQALGDLGYAECRDAVIAHYRDSREFIMPADIRARVKRVRRDQSERDRARIVLDPAAYRASVEARDKAFLARLTAAGRRLGVITPGLRQIEAPKPVPARGADVPPRHEQLAALEALIAEGGCK
jgi:hypothetical protein